MSCKYRDLDVNSQVKDDYRFYREKKKKTNDKPSKLQKKKFFYMTSVTIQVFLHARMK